jgi:2-keto-4-pentenoate hydratase/2-oxohepta-3-ene-1,7-dioic acid hydratase in catechol pathway
MKLVTFKSENSDKHFRLGAFVSDSEIIDLTTIAGKENLSATELLDCFDLDGEFLSKANSALEQNDLPKISKDQIEICAPVPRPGQIICIGLNYRDHAEESGMAIPKSPIIFSKFVTCVTAPNHPILLPKGSEQVDYEAEFAFVIGRRAKYVKREEAMNYVLGYTNFNDVSARDFQFADGQWQRGKACDTFAPMGEFIATANEIADPHQLRIQFRLNGKTLQDSTTNQLIFKIPELIEFLSNSMTLEVGDVIATGTPPGVGFARKPPIFMQDGDVAEVEIEGLGVLSNVVSGR